MRIPFVDLSAQYASLKDEINSAVQDILSSSAFINGPAVGDFEQAFSELLGIKHVCGTNSGTDSLQMAVKACGIGPGDEVITVVNTWISTAFAVSNVSALPVLVDIDPTTYQMDVFALEQAITPKTKAVIPVHMFGHPAPMKAIMALCRERGIKVIEDAAQAPLAKENGEVTGTIGDIGCFSFYPSKNLGCYGDGGAVTTNDDELARRMRILIDYGQSRPHHHEMVGHNARLDTLQAAILLVKIAHLEKWTAMRRHNAKLYQEALSGLPLKLPSESATAKAVYHLYVVQTDARDECLKYLNKQGVMAQVHYPNLIHRQPCYKDLGYKKGDFPVAESIVGRALSLPMYAELSEAQIGRISDLLVDFFGGP